VATSGPPSLASVRAALCAAFEECSTELRRRVDEVEGGLVRGPLGKGGSTALLLCAVPGCGVWCANAGDTRAVACCPAVGGGDHRRRRDRGRTHIARRISIDHTPEEPAEYARVMAAGGEVEFGCLEGVLEVSRSFGDFDFVGMTAEPHVAGPLHLGMMTHERSRGSGGGPALRQGENQGVACSGSGPSQPGAGAWDRRSFVLLASDGLWDACTDQEAADFAAAHLAGQLSANAATQLPPPSPLTRAGSAVRGGEGGEASLAGCARALGRWAAERGSKDDITVVVVGLTALAAQCEEEEEEEEEPRAVPPAPEMMVTDAADTSPGMGQPAQALPRPAVARRQLLVEEEQRSAPAPSHAAVHDACACYEVVRATRGGAGNATNEWVSTCACVYVQPLCAPTCFGSITHTIGHAAPWRRVSRLGIASRSRSQLRSSREPACSGGPGPRPPRVQE
jgi:serine/threonine protein phosphatase PrpC